MPVDLLSPIILEVTEQRDDFEAKGGAQPLSPGHAFQLNQVETDSRRELRRMDSIVEAAQTQLLQEFEERKAHELAPKHIYSDEGESEMDPDDSTLADDHYPSDSELGEDDAKCGEETEGGLGMEVVMEEMLVQDEWVALGAQYLEQQAFKAERPVPGLHKQKDIDVEVTVTPRTAAPGKQTAYIYLHN
jgi:hypothetical protein